MSMERKSGTVPAKFDRDEFLRVMELRANDPMEQISVSDDWRVKLQKIRRNYERYQRWVDCGDASWSGDDPYQIADWAPLFTPIEAAVWGDIRRNCLPLWPQFPVGRFFVDFGSPEHRIALECDGSKFHDAARDSLRDAELAKGGWRVFRIPGSKCLRVIDDPAGYEDMSDDDRAQHEAMVDEQTTRGLMKYLRLCMRGAA